MPLRRPALSGIGYVLAGFLIFSINDATRRHLATLYPIEQILAWGSLLAVALLLLVALRHGWRATLLTRQPGLQAFRAILVAAAAYLAVFSFAHAEMVAVYTMIFTAPIITGVLAALLLGERLTLPRVLAVALGFSGTLIVLQPQNLQLAPGMATALILAFVFSLANILVRRLNPEEGNLAMAVYPLGLLCLGFGIIGGYFAQPPQFEHLGWFALAGLLQACGLLFIIVGFRRVEASVAAPFQYSQLLWGLGLGYVFFGEIPSLNTWLGAAIIVGAGLGLWAFETRRK